MTNSRRFKSAFVATLAVAAFAAAPAFARFDLEPAGASGTVPQSTASVCSEACSGAGYGPPDRVNPLAETGARLPHNPRTVPVEVPRSQPVVFHVVPHSGGSFDWGAAGIGAGVVVLAVLVAGGIIVLERRGTGVAHGHTAEA